MLTYLNRVKQLVATLQSVGVEIDDQEFAMAALNGLPSTYESLIVALDALGNEKRCLTFELVKSRLHHNRPVAAAAERDVLVETVKTKTHV